MRAGQGTDLIVWRRAPVASGPGEIFTAHIALSETLLWGARSGQCCRDRAVALKDLALHSGTGRPERSEGMTGAAWGPAIGS